MLDFDFMLSRPFGFLWVIFTAVVILIVWSYLLALFSLGFILDKILSKMTPRKKYPRLEHAHWWLKNIDIPLSSNKQSLLFLLGTVLLIGAFIEYYLH